MPYQVAISNLRPVLLLMVVLVFTGLVGCAAPPEKHTPVTETSRTLKNGKILGTTGQSGGHQWLGIPYARPPVDERRWSAPEPPSAWTDTYPALGNGSPCPQIASPLGGVTTAPEGTIVGDEDCLYLDVYAPKFSLEEVPEGGERLPVMVWIHGGGNVIGHSGLYDASRLASEENVIVVAVQYRLGPLGWFRHPSLRGPETSRKEASGNYALLDLIRSLRWVNRNISEFGGDPDNVTIFGESAGGRNVYNLMLSPPAEGLFDRAIVQSGVIALTDPSRAEKFKDNGGHPNSSKEVLLRLLRRDGRADDSSAARQTLKSMSQSEVEKYLRTKNPDELIEVYEQSELGMPIDPPRVFADGSVLPVDDPLNVFNDPNRYNDVPIITGTNRNETKIFLSQDDRWVSQVLGFIPRIHEPDLYQVVSEYTSRQWKANAVDQPAKILSESQDGVYGYRFDWDELPTYFGSDLSSLLGASHGFEIPFVFGDFTFGGEMSEYLFTQQNESSRLKLSRTMMAFWAQFARSGNPNTDSIDADVQWTEWEPGEDGRYMVFDTQRDEGLRMESTTYDPDYLKESVEKDDRLASQRERCVVYRALATYVGGMTREDYSKIKSCENFAWHQYPWVEPVFDERDIEEQWNNVPQDPRTDIRNVR